MSDLVNDLKPCSVIILAAGKSSRMKRPKFALAFDENYTFLEKIIQEYDKFGCEEIIVVLNQEGISEVNRLNLVLKNSTIVVNEHPEWERFYSIQLGIQQLHTKHPVFIHNADNPFVNLDILKSMIALNGTPDYVVPSYKGIGGHPILISDTVCQAIVSEKNKACILSDFLKKFEQKRVVVNDEHILININTKEIYKEYFG